MELFTEPTLLHKYGYGYTIGVLHKVGPSQTVAVCGSKLRQLFHRNPYHVNVKFCVPCSVASRTRAQPDIRACA